MKKQMRSLPGRIVRYFKYSMPIKSKLAVVFLLLIISSLCAFAWLSYISVAQSSAEQIRYSSEQAFYQTVDLLNYRIAKILYASDQLALDQKLIEIIRRDQDLSVSTTLVADFNEIKTILRSAFDKEEMYRITLLLDESILYSSAALSNVSSQSIAFAPISSFRETHDLLTSNRKVRWMASGISGDPPEPEIRTISCIRPIRDPDDYTCALGILCFDLRQDSINQMIERADVTS